MLRNILILTKIGYTLNFGRISKMIKTYTIKLEIDDTDEMKSKMTRTNDGFNGLELLGIIEIARNEILQQIAGAMKPDAIKRQFVEE